MLVHSFARQTPPRFEMTISRTVKDGKHYFLVIVDGEAYQVTPEQSLEFTCEVADNA
jgi:hypothetical protein